MAEQVGKGLRGRHLLLLTDYDGTLADLAPTPAEAHARPEVIAAIEAIEARSHVTFGVVSGRRLDDVKARVGLAGFVAGLHGLEIEGPGAVFRHDALDSVTDVIRNLAERAARSLAWCPGLYLEDKTYALTCHVRQVPDDLADRALAEFEALVCPEVDTCVLKLLTGAKALEVLPAVDWHKGRAAEWIRERLVPRTDWPVTIVYLGDDRTDEDAFDALGDEDIVIGVGDRPHTHLIDWRLDGPASVGRFIGHVAELLPERP